jgi:hypothetical protein
MIRLPQSTLPFIKALAVAVFAGTLVSCASKPQPAATPSISQTKEALKRIRPGISRKELYATLPPSSPPLTLVPPNIFRGPFRSEALEHHPLQDRYFVEVQYHRAQADTDLDDIDLMILAKDTATGGWVPSREHPQDTVLRISDLQRKP